LSEKILYIEWEDNCSLMDGGWHRPHVFENRPITCHSIGAVIAEDEHAITLAGSWHNGLYSGDQTILKKCIKKRRRVYIK
jgi:hypothetical protein